MSNASCHDAEHTPHRPSKISSTSSLSSPSPQHAIPSSITPPSQPQDTETSEKSRDNVLYAGDTDSPTDRVDKAHTDSWTSQHVPRGASHLPSSSKPLGTSRQLKKHERASAPTKQADCSSSRQHQASALSGPFDIFIYGDNPDTSVSAQQGPGTGSRTHQSASAVLATSSALPEHLIALPPLSGPSVTPSGRPSTPFRAVADSTTELNPSSVERAAYRSWREGKAVLGGRVMYGQESTGTGNVDGRPIDKKIEATLPRAEQSKNARSRKTTHHMRVFDQDSDALVDHNRLEQLSLGDTDREPYKAHEQPGDQRRPEICR